MCVKCGMKISDITKALEHKSFCMHKEAQWNMKKIGRNSGRGKYKFVWENKKWKAK